MFGRRTRAPEPVEYEMVPVRRRHRSVSGRRLLGVLVALGMIWGGVWLVMFSGLADPVFATAQPAVAFVKKAWDDPQGAIMIVATLMASHMGLLALIFDDRNV